VKLTLTEQHIEAFKNGDNSVLSYVYQDFAVGMGFVAYKYLQSEEDAKDVTMEVFDKLLKMNNEQRSRMPASPSGVKSWLNTIAKNYCLDVLKHQKIIDKHQQNHNHEDSVQSESERIWNTETFELLMSKLPQAEQRVCQMHFEGYSHEEICNELNISYNTLRNQLSSGKKKIRKYISDGSVVFIIITINLLM
jgi:RNA polymerase sigma factor (sigma-70 family)